MTDRSSWMPASVWSTRGCSASESVGWQRGDVLKRQAKGEQPLHGEVVEIAGESLTLDRGRLSVAVGDLPIAY